MITVMQWGAMYAKLEEGEAISRDPILLGGCLILPGTKIKRIGSKDRTAFEMRDRFCLKYEGMADGHLLFTSHPTGADGNPWYYAFSFVDPHTLLVGGESGCRDIRVDRIEFAEVSDS